MTTALARKWRLQVTTDLTLASNWVEVNGINDFSYAVTPNIEDSSDFSTSGWTAGEPTEMSWTVTPTFLRRNNANVYDAGQELIRNTVGQFGTAARIGARWFDRNGGPEANSGIAIPTWKPSQTAIKNLETVQVTLTGTDIALNQNIANPSTTGLVPVILSATPAAAGSGTSVAITGAGFTGTVATTGVKFGGTNATSFAVINDSLIVAVLPTAAAGSAPIIVTNAAGASTAFAYTRGA